MTMNLLHGDKMLFKKIYFAQFSMGTHLCLPVSLQTDLAELRT